MGKTLWCDFSQTTDVADWYLNAAEGRRWTMDTEWENIDKEEIFAR